ncbi:hypothetical protein BAUCODRAFT_79159 [Baudoinia panamericana UAMH 10762]|uniref:Uncharacterized protein n=1 Tax=Baudoinia panamericana (strain UAMH 10762) TaxID=717646 RepID=M2MJW2_BAUPA|nr:uncharacterized protein BAUCODRAFT_79159 [Baudoinia panamericana UAMH 10762]EMC91603.1 hypothetical protein BAUCODRAFT_79159 [Baudoinia panamericana UAMH 10762]
MRAEEAKSQKAATESGRHSPVDSARNSPPAFRPVAHTRGQRRGDAAAAIFAKLRASYEKKTRDGTVTWQEDIEFMKLEGAEDARLRKLEADEEYDRQPSPVAATATSALFMSDEELPGLPQSDDDASDDEPEPRKKRKRGVRTRDVSDDDDDNDRPAPKRGRGRPKGRRAGKNPKLMGADVGEDDIDEVLNRARSSGKKGKAAGAGKKKTALAAKGRTQKRKSEATMTNLNSIMGTNVFNDAQAVSGLANQPVHSGVRRKDKALAALLASIPEPDQKIGKQDQKYLDNAIRDFTGQGSVKAAPDGNWELKGMKTTLKHYQVMGVAFMRRRERDSYEPKGGILADQMGLGKTIMMLANIINGKPPEKEEHRATLIVASPALVSQWRAEIEKHSWSKRENKHGIGTIIESRAGCRLQSNNSEELLEQADIVLTTYHEVGQSYPKAIFPPQLVTSKQKEEWWKHHYEENRGILHRARFYRVVLDEAHAIKNHKGHISNACRGLTAKHRWAITGTPIMNNIKEFYPYFKFLQEPNTGSYKLFKENFCSPDDPDGIVKLSAFLRKFMIRRTHLDRLFNARLLDLPTPTEHTQWLEFSDVERQVYEIVKRRFIERINSISRAGGRNGLEKQYSHIWTMILRLRQIVDHILLVQVTVCDLLERSDFEKLDRITTDEDDAEDGTNILLHLREVLKKSKSSLAGNSATSGAIITEDDTAHIGRIDMDPDEDSGGRHGKTFRFRRYLEDLMHSDQWEKIRDRTVCAACRQPPQDPHVTSCLHIYCATCALDLQAYAARRGSDQAKCSECGEAYTSLDACKDVTDFVRSESSRASATPAASQTRTKGKKRDDIGNMSDWIGMDGEVLPSAKTRATKAQLLNWFEEDPEVKVIIYSQFLPMIRILKKMCATEDWGKEAVVEYTGNMSHDSRAKAINEFEADPAKKIMLASLKCGGLGLNLTMASRVICVDPWWNNAVTQQAFCRVYRIGQVKETKLTSFCVRNSIDEAMHNLKEKKQMEIDEVMDDKRRQNLTVNELMRLFGPVGEDDDGKPFIFPEKSGEDDDHPGIANSDDEDLGNEA